MVSNIQASNKEPGVLQEEDSEGVKDQKCVSCDRGRALLQDEHSQRDAGAGKYADLRGQSEIVGITKERASGIMAVIILGLAGGYQTWHQTHDKITRQGLHFFCFPHLLSDCVMHHACTAEMAQIRTSYPFGPLSLGLQPLCTYL